MFHRMSILLLSVVVLVTTGQACAAALKVRMVLSDSSPPYQQFAEAFYKTLASSEADVNVVESHRAGDSHADLIVAVGVNATELAATQAGAPVLAVMVPEPGYRELLARASPQAPARAISAIYLSQPWERQLYFLQAAFPERRRIGLIYSEGSRVDIENLRQRIANRGGSLVASPVPSAEKLFPSLEGVLESSDLLQAVPDSAIYNGSTIRNILLASYRRGIPLIGLSQSYVNAGALCAVFSTTEQIAEQAGATVISYAKNRRLPEPQFPANFTVAVNQQVARSLGIEMPTEETIRSRMDKAVKLGEPEKRER